ncbi:PilZ domain-containing protein [Neptunomonas concharum]|uniref:PilZ domain-containing protein n=1 Tax=Neptunomonas concharum TaxID=1031538 RepID=A0A5P1RE40_9GAMM|nr:PilZ domain-containing protein [Neptunomonas concharum]QEQ97552.1 PilZ domain-containing protein [Neptunomonas concharum]
MKPVIEIDTDQETQRRNFRVVPAKDDPVSLKVAGVRVNIVDISAHGVAFQYAGDVKKEVYPITLSFTTDKDYEIHCPLKLIWRKPPEYSGEFVGITEKDVSNITTLIVECQKRAIRRQKAQEAEKRKNSGE